MTLPITLIALLVPLAFALVLGFVVGDPELYIDIALMYALIGFIGTVAVLKVSEFGNLGQPQSHTDAEDA